LSFILNYPLLGNVAIKLFGLVLRYYTIKLFVEKGTMKAPMQETVRKVLSERESARVLTSAVIREGHNRNQPIKVQLPDGGGSFILKRVKLK